MHALLPNYHTLKRVDVMHTSVHDVMPCGCVTPKQMFFTLASSVLKEKSAATVYLRLRYHLAPEARDGEYVVGLWEWCLVPCYVKPMYEGIMYFKSELVILIC